MKPKESKKTSIVAVTLSLAAHSILLLMLLWFLPKIETSKRIPLEMRLTETKKEHVIKNNNEHKKTVVALSQPTKEHIKPKLAHHLSDHDQTVDKEKTAQKISSQPNELKENKKNSQKVRQKQHNNQLKQKVFNKNDPLGIRPVFDKNSYNSSSLQEHLPNVEEGDSTKLNAWQWRHAPFFNRMKTAIGNVWAPQIPIARYDPKGALLGYKDRVTVLSVTIDQNGELKKLLINNPSGVDYLDEEAKRALKVAAPFPFPPKELFNEHGDFSFTFAFYIQINRNMGFDFTWEK